MRAIKILKEYDEIKPYVDEVRTAADSHKNELGFLAKSAYSDMAIQNKLWVAIDSEKRSCIGYLLFGGLFPRLRIFQVFVLPKYRRQGVAKALVESFIQHAESKGYTNITARVADDLVPANRFWEENQFFCACQERGGKRKNRLINIRVRNLNTPTLLGSIEKPPFDPDRFHYIESPILEDSTYVLDLNVVFDIVRNRPRKQNTQSLLNAAHNQRIKICVTPEFIRSCPKTHSKAYNQAMYRPGRRSGTHGVA